MSADLLPYIKHVNFSNTLSATSTDVPKGRNVGRNSRCFLRSFWGVTFPFHTNALVLSQPVNACRAVRARLTSTPRSLATAWIFKRRHLSPVPVSNRTVWLIWRANLSRRINTSVSRDPIRMAELFGELAATCCEEHSFLICSEIMLFPSRLLKLIHDLSFTIIKLFPFRFQEYLSFFHSSRRKLYKRRLFHYTRTSSSHEELW